MLLMTFAGCARERRAEHSALNTCPPLGPAAIEMPQREIDVSMPSAQALGERFERVLTASGPHAIAFTEEELTSYLALGLGDAWLRNPQVWLTSQGVYMRADLTLHQTWQLCLLIRPTTHEGRLRVSLIAGSLGGHAIPRWVLASAESALNDALTDTELPVYIEELVLGEGSAHVTLTPR